MPTLLHAAAVVGTAIGAAALAIWAYWLCDEERNSPRCTTAAAHASDGGYKHVEQEMDHTEPRSILRLPSYVYKRLPRHVKDCTPCCSWCCKSFEPNDMVRKDILLLAKKAEPYRYGVFPAKTYFMCPASTNVWP